MKWDRWEEDTIWEEGRGQIRKACHHKMCRWAGRYKDTAKLGDYEKEEGGKHFGASQPGQGLAPSIHGKLKPLFMVSSFMYFQPVPI